ncbi:MAG: hypothetical protein ABGW92_01675 [Methanocaldococcus sp.]
MIIYSYYYFICGSISVSLNIIIMVIIFTLGVIHSYTNAKKHIEDTINELPIMSLEKAINDIDEVIEILRYNGWLEFLKRKKLKKKLEEVKKRIENVIALLGGNSENGTQNGAENGNQSNDLREAKNKIENAIREILKNNILGDYRAIENLNEAKDIINNKINELNQPNTS